MILTPKKRNTQKENFNRVNFFNIRFLRRDNPMGLIVSLDEMNKANGELFWDDGVTFNIYSKNK